MEEESCIELIEAKEEDTIENYERGIEDFGEDENVPPSDTQNKMVNISDYITDDELERKMEKVLLEGRRIDEKCKTCEGLSILHKLGPCTRSDTERAQDKDAYANLRYQLFDIWEDYRILHKEDVRSKRMMEAFQGGQVATIETLFRGFAGINKETIVTKPKLPPRWTIETFDRSKEEVNH